jgi:hypothetical protein
MRINLNDITKLDENERPQKPRIKPTKPRVKYEEDVKEKKKDSWIGINKRLENRR